MSGSTFLLSAHFSAKSARSHNDFRRTCDVIALYRYAVSICDNHFLLQEMVVYPAAADKYRRLTHRLSQEQKGLDEKALMVSQRLSDP
jgi:hypothetical protein